MASGSIRGQREARRAHTRPDAHSGASRPRPHCRRLDVSFDQWYAEYRGWTPTVRRQHARPQTAAEYAAVFGVSLADARLILAGEKRPPMLAAETCRAQYRPQRRIEPTEQAKAALKALAARQRDENAERRQLRRAMNAISAPPMHRNDHVTVERIAKATCRYFGMSEDEFFGDRRTYTHVVPRSVAMVAARNLCNVVSTGQLGAYFRRDHSTIIYACQKHERRLKEWAGYAEAYKKVCDEVERLAARGSGKVSGGAVTGETGG